MISGTELEHDKNPNVMSMGIGISEKDARQRLNGFINRTGWADLPAVQKGEVFALYHGGARTLSDYVYAQFIAKQLYPEAFKDVDPVQNLRDYYQKWLPIPADGVFMTQYHK